MKVFWLTVAIIFLGALALGPIVWREISARKIPIVSLATTTTPAASPSSDSAPLHIPEGYEEYKNEEFGFSVYVPKELPAKEFVDRGPELTVVFQESQGQPGFQIYVSPIDGTTITQERFLRDAPSGVRLEERSSSVGGVQAVQFYGFDASIGKTIEVWFVRGHFLYEVSTYKGLEQDLWKILETWRFL